MRVCIVGCGAVGSLFAAHLAQVDGVEVWAYDPMEAHVEAINRDGLRLVGEAQLTGRVRATTDAAELPACEFGIVATKSMYTGAAIAQAAHAFSSGAVASVQNGVGNEEVIAEHVAARDPGDHVSGRPRARAGRGADGHHRRHVAGTV